MIKENQIAAVIAANINHYLDVNKMSRKELATKVGVSLASVGFWCAGTKIPRMDKIDKMCAIFDCERSNILMDHIVASSTPSTLTTHEQEHIRKYRAIDDDGREMVDAVLDTAYKQITDAGAQGFAS